MTALETRRVAGEYSVGTMAVPGVGTWIEQRARVAPDRVAIIHDRTCRTYGALASRVRRLAHGLRSLGVMRGDRIAWIGQNHPAFLEVLFAAAKLGAALTPISHQLEGRAIRALLFDAAPRVVLLNGAPADPIGLRGVATVRVDSSDEENSEYERLIAAAVDAPIDEAVMAGEVCLLPFTSGTTGEPKGVMLTHGNVTWNVINCLSSLDIRSDDVTLAVAPFFRAGGTGVNVLPVLFQGGTVVIPRAAAPGEVVQLIERHRVTKVFGSPDLLGVLARAREARFSCFGSLRAVIVGGAPVSERLLRTCRDRGLTVLQGYGLSEAAPVVSVLDAANASTKIGSAGRPAPFVDTRVVGPDRTDVAVGEVGELLVRGPNVMAGYWRRPEATARTIDAQGWLRTGDAVRMDDEGFLFIVGRIEDAYVSSGRLVHPGVAEHLLLSHPSVAEVCVLGEDAGAVAYIVPSAGVTAGLVPELSDLCARCLAAPARPVAFDFVACLPKNPAAKVLRRRLRTAHAGAAICFSI